MYLLDLFHRTFVATVKDEGVDFADAGVWCPRSLVIGLGKIDDLFPVTDQFAPLVDR